MAVWPSGSGASSVVSHLPEQPVPHLWALVLETRSPGEILQPPEPGSSNELEKVVSIVICSI